MRVGDPVAEARPLAADVADSSHGIAPLVCEEAGCGPGAAGASGGRISDSRPPARTGARHARPAPPAVSAGRLSFEPMASLDEPLRGVVGGKAAARAEKAFGLRTTGDLLRHYPRRYVRRGELTDLASLRDGEDVTVFAQVAKVTSRRMRNRRGQMLQVAVTERTAPSAATCYT